MPPGSQIKSIFASLTAHLGQAPGGGQSELWILGLIKC